MRNAKIISYKVKGSFQHNCSMFAERKIFLFSSSWLSSSSLSMPLAPSLRDDIACCWEQKQKPIFHFITIIFSTLYEPWQKRGEYLKNDEKFLFLFFAPFRLPPMSSSLIAAAFALFICERLLRFLFAMPPAPNARRVIIEQATKKHQMTTPFRSQISELCVRFSSACLFSFRHAADVMWSHLQLADA